MVFSFNTAQIPVITYMNRAVTPENWKHCTRTTEEYILYFVHEGDMYIAEGGERYALHPGDMLLLEPGRTHAGYQEAYCCYSYIHFLPAAFTALDVPDADGVSRLLADSRSLLYTCNPFCAELYRKAALYVPKRLHVSETSHVVQISQCMDAAIRAFDMKYGHFKLLCSCKAVEILTLISLSFADRQLQGSGRPKPVSRNRQTVNTVLNLLHTEYAGKLTGEAVAARVGLNFDYLNRIFKRQIGMTIFAYVNMLRINKSKELLVNGNMKLHDIAVSVGFCDEYRFSKAFRQTVGTTPRRFR
jgi:AraC-like DNA-binding protein